MVRDVAALKAVSQNLMHENLSITDGVYGILSENDVRRQIAMLSKNGTGADGNTGLDLGTLLQRLDEVVREMQRHQSG